MIHLSIASRTFINTLINKRQGETKLGEQVQTVHEDNWQEEVKTSGARFVLLGIPEDIGVRANHGVGGTHTLWRYALQCIMNIQDTDVLKGDCLLVLGMFDFHDMIQRTAKADVMELRELVNEIDEAVTPVINTIIKAGKIPIVIGGGHNNAFPLLQGACMARDEQVNCINLDAHSDYRIMEGRHSGNGFRYARKKGYLDKYAVVGLHENYNAQTVLDDMALDHNIYYSFYEDIFIREQMSFKESVEKALSHTSGRKRGVELDLDCIERVLSSAETPSGITALQARQYVTWCGLEGDAAYLHLPEGAISLHNKQTDNLTGKLVAYLVTDFMKAVMS